MCARPAWSCFGDCVMRAYVIRSAGKVCLVAIQESFALPLETALFFMKLHVSS
jgi:hypothetical protein